MAKLTDKQKKHIIAELVEGRSIRALAKKYNVSTTTIQRIKNNNDEVKQKVTQKKESNTKDILEHMDKKKNIVCSIIDEYLVALTDSKRLKNSSTREVATVLGILIDKFATPSTESDKNNGILDEMNEYFRRKNAKNAE